MNRISFNLVPIDVSNYYFLLLNLQLLYTVTTAGSFPVHRRDFQTVGSS